MIKQCIESFHLCFIKRETSQDGVVQKSKVKQEENQANKVGVLDPLSVQLR